MCNSYLSIFGTSVEHGMRRVFMVFVLYWLRYTDTFFLLFISFNWIGQLSSIYLKLVIILYVKPVLLSLIIKYGNMIFCARASAKPDNFALTCVQNDFGTD